MLWVSRSVRHPVRAAARAASVPAWPPPTTITSNWVGKSMAMRCLRRESYVNVPRGTNRGVRAGSVPRETSGKKTARIPDGS